MKVPKRILEAINKKQDSIDKSRDDLENQVVKLQNILYDSMLKYIIPELDVKDGIIQDTLKNYQLLTGLDNQYRKFINYSFKIIVPLIGAGTAGISDLVKEYFKTVLPQNLDIKKFESITEAVTTKLNARIGLTANEGLVSGGWLETNLADNSVKTQIKNYVAKAVTGQIGHKEFLQGLSNIIKGIPKEVIQDGKKVIVQTGATEKQYQRYVFDLFQQFDRAYNLALADEYNMQYFIYQGGLISDSRDFCVCHNNKVWSRDESADWDTWKPYMGEYPAGYVIKQKDIYEIPSYLGYPGYQPLIDAGGYNCRHSIGYISDDLATSLRPELNLTNTKPIDQQLDEIEKKIK